MSNEFAITVNIDTEVDESSKDFENVFKKDLEKALRAVCLKHSIDLYRISVDLAI